MTTNILEEEMKNLENEIEDVRYATVDDYNSESAIIFIGVEDRINLRKMTNTIKKFFKKRFGYKLYLSYDRERGNYEIDFPYAYYSVQEDILTDLPDTLVFSQKLDEYGYSNLLDQDFGRLVMETANVARSTEDHINRIQRKLPEDYTVSVIYTFEHSQDLHLTFDSGVNGTYYGFDSDGRGMIAYKNAEDADKVIAEINEDIVLSNL